MSACRKPLREILGSRPGIPARIADIGCQRLALQAGGPWGHSDHIYQCYGAMADRQGCAVEVARIFCEGVPLGVPCRAVGVRSLSRPRKILAETARLSPAYLPTAPRHGA